MPKKRVVEPVAPSVSLINQEREAPRKSHSRIWSGSRASTVQAANRESSPVASRRASASLDGFHSSTARASRSSLNRAVV
ncbi:hypothetical protein D3C84_1085150 [compost metagenome]